MPKNNVKWTWSLSVFVKYVRKRMTHDCTSFHLKRHHQSWMTNSLTIRQTHVSHLHFVWPPRFCLSIVFNFSRNNYKGKVIQSVLWEMWKWWIQLAQVGIIAKQHQITWMCIFKWRFRCHSLRWISTLALHSFLLYVFSSWGVYWTTIMKLKTKSI